MKYRFFLIFVSSVFCLMFTVNTNAAFSDMFVDPLDGKFDASRYLSENAYGFLPVPIIITDPAVEGGLGVVGVFFNETKEQQEQRLSKLQSKEGTGAHILPESISAVIALGTGNKSWLAGGGHLAFWKQGKIRYAGFGGYGDVNLDFYGTGDVQFKKPLSVNTKAYGLMQSIKFKLAESHFYLGPVQRVISAKIQPTSLGIIDDSDLPQNVIDEIRRALTVDTFTSALGITLEFDSRDNFFSPKDGYQYRLDALRFDETIGSDLEYNLFEFEGINYWRFSKIFRAGLKIQSDHVTDAPSFLPPYATPTMQLRGVPAGRYQGRHVQSAELEVNYQVNFRWELLAFAGLGRIANEFSALSSADNLYNKGVGFRYLVARRYGFNMGIDIANGPEENVFYIQAGSAW